MKCMRNLQLANGAREYTNIKQTYDYFFMNEYKKAWPQNKISLAESLILRYLHR